MSPCPAASLASARGLESWAGSSAVTTATKKAFGMCEGAANTGMEERREGASTTVHPGNAPRTSRLCRRQQQQQLEALAPWLTLGAQPRGASTSPSPSPLAEVAHVQA